MHLNSPRSVFACCALLVALSAVPAAAAEVFIDRLICHVAEDMTILGGADECRLHVYVDGIEVRTMRFSLRPGGHEKVLNQRYEAQREVRLVLMEEDTPDADDHLGTITIPLTPTSSGQTWITGRFWQYALRYRVTSQAATPATYFLTLDSLQSIHSEDSGKDQCMLQIYADGRLVDTLNAEVREGTTWNLESRRYAYQTSITVRLWDLDYDTFGGGHDRLGDVVIGQTVGPNRGGQFLRDGASYHLRYRVSAVR